MNQNGRSTRADRLASPRSWATKRKLKRSAKAAISGTGTISRPVPRSTTTWVLSIMTRSGLPPKYRSASVREDFAIEALKRCVALKEQHARVAPHGRSGLYFAFLSSQFECVEKYRAAVPGRAGSRIADDLLRRLGQPMPATEDGQCLVGKHRPTGG